MITSKKNPQIKFLRKLRKRRFRQEQATFSVEGFREIRSALNNQFKLKQLFFCSRYLSQSAKELLLQHNPAESYEVSESVFDDIAVREQSDGVLAAFTLKSYKLSDLGAKRNFILILDQIEKPGNLGAILRTAVGAGVDAIFLVGQSVDLYNPNVIRASLGAAFVIPVINLSMESAVEFCQDNQIQLVAASPHAKNNFFDGHYREPTAFVLGSEAHGLSDIWLQKCSSHVSIPLQPGIDSLNLSVAAGILCFELVRQRQC